jgi:hypothetical protein
LALVMALAACTEWHVESTSPRDLVEVTHPARLRVTRNDSTSSVIERPAFVGDTLTGLMHGNAWATALPDIAHVAVRRTSGVHTALLVGGLAAFTAGTIASSSDHGGPTNLRF